MKITSKLSQKSSCNASLTLFFIFLYWSTCFDNMERSALADFFWILTMEVIIWKIYKYFLLLKEHSKYTNFTVFWKKNSIKIQIEVNILQDKRVTREDLLRGRFYCADTVAWGGVFAWSFICWCDPSTPACWSQYSWPWDFCRL